MTIPRPSSIMGSFSMRLAKARISRFSFPSLTLGLLAAFLCFNPATAVPGSAMPDKKAEKPYALIYGTVWGPDNRPLYGVPVEIRRADQKRARWELHSDHRGEFALRVPPGPADYVVWPDLKGFKYPGAPLHLDQEVKVHIDGEEREDIGLHLTQ